ncbi:MAG: lipoprotein-releasing system ATP-binding protein [Bryobacterales bacterium]|jgi:lipoprotein-releasing system ATP-binding protein|nr:lipoprotein-releasing system ATP-binding protein [Bryobacterales bacterium]
MEQEDIRAGKNPGRDLEIDSEALKCRLATPTQIATEPGIRTDLIRIEKLAKVYRSGDSDLVIFHELDLSIAAGDQVAIIGPSGSGKSTLLHLIAGLDSPTSGTIYYRNKNITNLPEAELSAFRNREIGYVWQQHHLLPEFTAEENVMMPLLIRGVAPAKARSEALVVLEEVELSARGHHRAGELSGGEQQRIAIARALVAGPSLLLADEPTGNLDGRTGEMIFRLLADLRRRRRLTTILVTHNLQFARECNRVLKLEGGALYPELGQE